MISVVEAHEDQPLCNILNVLFAITGIAAVNFIVMRCVRLWFKHHIARDRLQTLSKQMSFATALTWYTRRRKWVQSRYLFAAALLLSVFDVALASSISPSLWSRGGSGVDDADESCVPVFATIVARGSAFLDCVLQTLCCIKCFCTITIYNRLQ